MLRYKRDHDRTITVADAQLVADGLRRQTRDTVFAQMTVAYPKLCDIESGPRKIGPPSGDGDEDVGPQRSVLGGVSEKGKKSRAASRVTSSDLTIVGVLIAAIIGVVVWQALKSKAPATSASTPRAVAVLPFQNATTNKDVDFLSLALPDEIATTLSSEPRLSIRPFSTTSKYTDPHEDLQRAGREMGVSEIVTGHYLMAGKQLEITLEAVDVADNRIVWREAVSLTGGLLASSELLPQGSLVRLMFVTPMGPVLGTAEMLPPLSLKQQPFRFTGIEEAGILDAPPA